MLGFSDRDIQKYYKSLGDFKGKKTLNDKLKKTCYNYKPDLIVTGHADLISREQIQELKRIILIQICSMVFRSIE